MPFADLIEAADLLLSENGVCSNNSFKEEDAFLALAKEHELYPHKDSE
jgi:tRNA1Val (adenine37-N6)-methyltransferase